jgi:tetratricopeptide (TPR) repeat protein
MLLLCGICLMMSFQISLLAELSTTDFDVANKLYEQAKFTEAASVYEKLLRSGEASIAVYYNLGNAFFKAGQLGQAIAAYYRAQQIAPRDPDLRANLQFARNQVQGPTMALPKWQQWLTHLSLDEWTWLAALAFWVWLLLLTLGQLRPTLKPSLRHSVIGMGAVTVLLAACLAMTFQLRSSRAAIVIAHEAVVRQAPIDEAQSAFTVHDGAELEILDQKDNWLQVSTDPRRFGWLRRDQVLITPRS